MQWDYLAQDEPQTEEERLRDKYYLTYSPDTLAHEAGHWLGLSHTHEVRSELITWRGDATLTHRPRAGRLFWHWSFPW